MSAVFWTYLGKEYIMYFFRKEKAFIMNNKFCFIMGIPLYGLFCSIIWFLDFTGIYCPYSVGIFTRAFKIPPSSLEMFGFPFSIDSNLFPPLQWLIGPLWCGLCLVVLKKSLPFLKLIFHQYHLQCNRNLCFYPYLYRGILIGIISSLFSILFNPFFLLTIDYFSLIYSYSLVEKLKAHYYILFIIMYLSTSIISGLLYGILWYYLSKYKVEFFDPKKSNNM